MDVFESVAHRGNKKRLKLVIESLKYVAKILKKLLE